MRTLTRPRRLLTLGPANPKIAKAPGEFATAILHLAPHDIAGGPTVCSHSTPECRRLCLNWAGRGGIFRKGEDTNPIQEARIARTRFFHEDPTGFLEALHREIEAHRRRAGLFGAAPVVRLNGTSDIAWEVAAPELFTSFPDVQFYDYTKARYRALRWADGKLPPNYHLTYSRSERTTGAIVRTLVGAGVNVATVYLEKPTGFDGGLPVIDGDAHDLRFLDPRGVIVALRAKGPARKGPIGGFVLERGGIL